MISRHKHLSRDLQRSVPIKELSRLGVHSSNRYRAVAITQARSRGEGPPNVIRKVAGWLDTENSPTGWVGRFSTTGIESIPPIGRPVDLLKSAAEKLTFGGPSRDKRWLGLRLHLREMPMN